VDCQPLEQREPQKHETEAKFPYAVDVVVELWPLQNTFDPIHISCHFVPNPSAKIVRMERCRPVAFLCCQPVCSTNHICQDEYLRPKRANSREA
jgi:hypothetical protein